MPAIYVGNIDDMFRWIAPPTLETEVIHKNCKGVQSSGTMHKHRTEMHIMQVTVAQGNSGVCAKF